MERNRKENQMLRAAHEKMESESQLAMEKWHK